MSLRATFGLSVICKEEEFQVDYFVLFLRGLGIFMYGVYGYKFIVFDLFALQAALQIMFLSKSFPKMSEHTSPKRFQFRELHP